LTFAFAPDGALTRAAELPLPYPMVEGVTQIILHPSASWLLFSATNGSPGLEDQLLPVAADGTLGQPSVISQEFYGFAWDPTGRYFYGFDGEAIFQYLFELTAGTITPSDPLHADGSAGRTVLALHNHPAGRWVYSVEEGALGLFDTDSASGVLQARSHVTNPIPAEPIYWTSLALHASGRFLYALGYVAGTRLALVDAFAIDPATGALRFLERETGAGPHALTHEGLQAPLLLGDHLYLGGQATAEPHRGQPIVTTYRIDASGTLTPAGDPLGLPDLATLAGAPTGSVSFLFAAGTVRQSPPSAWR
jgi:6-phosphogluconolactonase (cycloisomerase 2 family)